MLKGLRDAGVDVTSADLIIGTSAGAVVGSLLRLGISLDDLYAISVQPVTSTATTAQTDRQREVLQAIARLGPANTPAVRIEVGKLALTADAVPEEDEVRRWRTALGFPREWPSGALKLTAFDIATGLRVIFDRQSGVPWERALAASNAAPGTVAPITIGASRYMDGGLVSTNMDIAAGHDVVLVLRPRNTFDTTAEIADLRSHGSQVMDMTPDPDALAAIGPNRNDQSHRGPAAVAGLRQGSAGAESVRTFWSGRRIP